MAEATNTTTEETLTMLKCPFCGKDATLEKQVKLYGPDGIRVDWSIECNHCHKSDGGKTYSTWYKVTDDELLEKVNPNNDDETPDGRARVIKAWNKRATAVEPEKKPEDNPSTDTPATDNPPKDTPSTGGETKGDGGETKGDSGETTTPGEGEQTSPATPESGSSGEEGKDTQSGGSEDTGSSEQSNPSGSGEQTESNPGGEGTG